MYLAELVSVAVLLVAALGAPLLDEYGNDRQLYGDSRAFYESLIESLLEQAEDDDVHMSAVPGWPSAKLKLGQVAGLAVCPMGSVHVLHRADRVWTYGTFNGDKFTESDKGPIDQPTILTLTADKGELEKSIGAKIPGCDVKSDETFCGFYLPHGLTIDRHGHRWVTDVALHQVVRIPVHAEVPDLVLGKKLTPGSDSSSFCKPTDVAVMSDGSFYVSDGYCNSRVVYFSPNGTRLEELGSGWFNIPHSLALSEPLDLLCVADRENGRIVCFRASTNQFEFVISSAEFGGRVFAVEFHPTRPLLFAVNGPNSRAQPVAGFTIDITSRQVVDRWNPPSGSFSAPHDVTSDSSGSVYVGEISPNTLWEFN